MTLWFRKTSGLNTDTMREIADASGVSWSAKKIVYRGQGIGFADGDEADADALQDAAESLLGYRPVVIATPPKRDRQAESE